MFLTLGKCTVSARDDLKLKDHEGSFALYSPCALSSVIVMELRNDLWVSYGAQASTGVGNGNPLQYSCPENSMDRGAWHAILHGVAESNTIERLIYLHTQAST